MIGVAAEVGEQDIKLWLAARLAPDQNPRTIVMVDAFERTASRRIMKHKLADVPATTWDRMARRT